MGSFWSWLSTKPDTTYIQDIPLETAQPFVLISDV